MLYLPLRKLTGVLGATNVREDVHVYMCVLISANSKFFDPKLKSTKLQEVIPFKIHALTLVSFSANYT